MNNSDEIMAVLGEAKKLARRYRALTGKPLGVTGEVAEFEAARILGLELVPPRQAGYARHVRLKDQSIVIWCSGFSPSLTS